MWVEVGVGTTSSLEMQRERGGEGREMERVREGVEGGRDGERERERRCLSGGAFLFTLMFF